MRLHGLQERKGRGNYVRIFKVVFAISLICLFSNECFAYRYRVMGDFKPIDKVSSDELKVDLAALSKITEPELLEVKQSKDRDNKDQVSLDIVFKDDLEAEDYFVQLVKQNQDARATIHKCTNSEYTGQENVSCVLEEEVILTRP